MARVNIDDELHADWRFKALARELESEDAAIGILYRFWRLAQDYWADGELLPLKIFEREQLEILLELEFAEKRDNGIYACGAKERFAWYAQRCAASIKGVEARKHKAEQPETKSGEPKNAPGLRVAQPNATDIITLPLPIFNATDKKEIASEASLPPPKKPRARKKLEYPPDFEAAWALYPPEFRGNKQDGAKEWGRLLVEDRLAARLSLDNVYSTYCSGSDGLPFLKHFCRFISKDEWREWVNQVPPAYLRRDTKTRPVKGIAEILAAKGEAV